MIDAAQKRNRIQFEYQEALNRAKELDALAEESERVHTALDEAFQSLKGGWEGEGANRFGQKGERLGEQFTADAKALRSAAEEVRRIAAVVRETELANLRIAMERGF